MRPLVPIAIAVLTCATHSCANRSPASETGDASESELPDGSQESAELPSDVDAPELAEVLDVVELAPPERDVPECEPQTWNYGDPMFLSPCAPVSRTPSCAFEDLVVPLPDPVAVSDLYALECATSPCPVQHATYDISRGRSTLWTEVLVADSGFVYVHSISSGVVYSWSSTGEPSASLRLHGSIEAAIDVPGSNPDVVLLMNESWRPDDTNLYGRVVGLNPDGSVQWSTRLSDVGTSMVLWAQTKLLVVAGVRESEGESGRFQGLVELDSRTGTAERCLESALFENDLRNVISSTQLSRRGDVAVALTATPESALFVMHGDTGTEYPLPSSHVRWGAEYLGEVGTPVPLPDGERWMALLEGRVLVFDQFGNVSVSHELEIPASAEHAAHIIGNSEFGWWFVLRNQLHFMQDPDTPPLLVDVPPLNMGPTLGSGGELIFGFGQTVVVTRDIGDTIQIHAGVRCTDPGFADGRMYLMCMDGRFSVWDWPFGTAEGWHRQGGDSSWRYDR